MKNNAAVVPHDDSWFQELQDPELAAEYLNASWKEGGKEAFLKALRKVLEARGGMSRISRLVGLSRASLYKMLQEDGNPAFENILKLLNAAGISFYFKAKEKKAPKTKSHRKAA